MYPLDPILSLSGAFTSISKKVYAQLIAEHQSGDMDTSFRGPGGSPERNDRSKGYLSDLWSRGLKELRAIKEGISMI